MPAYLQSGKSCRNSLLFLPPSRPAPYCCRDRTVVAGSGNERRDRGKKGGKRQCRFPGKIRESVFAVLVVLRFVLSVSKPLSHPNKEPPACPRVHCIVRAFTPRLQTKCFSLYLRVRVTRPASAHPSVPAGKRSRRPRAATTPCTSAYLRGQAAE